MNENFRFTEKELETLLDYQMQRIAEIEGMFSVDGDMIYSVSTIAPFVLTILSVIVAFVGDTDKHRDASICLLFLALIAGVVYKIDRIFEYVMVRFDMYDTMFTMEKDPKNEQPNQD